MPSLPRLLSATGLALSLATFPLQALAATPQQLVQQAFRTLITNPTQNAAQGTVEIRVQKTPLRRGVTASTQTGTLEFSVERETDGDRNVQGWVQLKKAANKTATSDQAFTFSPAPQVEFRSLNNNALFLRFGNVAPLLSALEVPISADLVAPFERWIKADASASTSLMSLPVAPTDEEVFFANLEKVKRGVLLAETKKIPALQVLSNQPLRAGSPLRRMKVRFHPAFVNLLEQEALKLDGRDQAKRRETQAMFKEARTELAKMQLAIVLDAQNAAKPTITRIEFFTRETTTEKGCDYTRFQRNGEPVLSSFTCALNMERVVTEIRGGVNLTQKTAVHVEPVAEATPIEQLVSQLFDVYLGSMSEGTGMDESDPSGA